MIPQKLIEEIAKSFDGICNELSAISMTRHLGKAEEQMVIEEWAGELAVRIRQAIEDGELQLTKIPPKLPGEEERHDDGARVYIAFRPEEKDEHEH